MSAGSLHIVIVDDHPLVRDGLRSRLESQAGWTVCGEAESASDAMALIRRVSPQVVIVDLSLKQGSGLNLIKQIVSIPAAPKVLVCSMHDEELYAQRSLQAGARGFLHKQQAAENLVTAIQRILEGKIYVSENIADRVLIRMLQHGKQASMNPVEQLTDRELMVFELIGRGSTLQQISVTLHLSVKTVETYRERAKRKLNVRTSAELLRYAVKWVSEHVGE